VEDSRYWSYLCADPACCPAEGVFFDPRSHPAAAALTAAGMPVLAGRDALAATITPVTGAAAEAMRDATERAERAARLLVASGPKALEKAGLVAVRTAIGVYRDGGSFTPAISFAWLALVLTRIRIRDDAWARMDPVHREAHRRLWTEVARRASPATPPPQRPCSRSPPGSAVTGHWPTWRSTAHSPTPLGTRWPCCCVTHSTQMHRRRRLCHR
jgi:hypothetical protein